MKFSKEFKEALCNLPENEKDKLLLRLLKKDIKLTNRLHFELVSDNSVDEERQAVRNELEKQIQTLANYSFSIGSLFMDVRYLSGMINEHVSRTNDKIGEVDLNIFLLTRILEEFNSEILNVTYAKAGKFCTSVIARAFKILLLINKLHPDYRIEFQEGLHKMGKKIGANPYLMETAIFNGFDVNWPLKGEIPEDIEEFHKELRSKGYLR